MIITKVTEKFMISSSRIVNITLDSKEDEKQSRICADRDRSYAQTCIVDNSNDDLRGVLTIRHAS